MADIDSIISGAGGNTRADFANFDPVKAFFDASKQRSDFDTRRMMQGGVPTTDGQPNGPPDFAAMSKLFFQHGDAGQGTALANLALQQGRLKYGQDTDATVNPSPNGAQPSAPVLPPSVNRSGSTPVAPALANGGAQPPQGNPITGSPQSATLAQILTAQNIVPNDQIGAASASLARQLGLNDPAQPFNPQDPQIRNVLVPALQQLKRMGIGQVQPPQGQQPPQGAPPQVAQAAPQGQPQAPPQQPQMAQPQAIPPQSGATDPRFVGLVPAGRSPDMQVHLLQRAIDSGNLPPEQVKSYQNAIDAIRKAAEPTAEEKSLLASKRNPGLDEYTTQKQADTALATGIAASNVKQQDQIIADGAAGQKRLTTLNAITGIVNSDPNISLGFGAEIGLKIKMALESMGVPKGLIGDLSGPQAIQKLNAALAAESTKGITARPSQFEFKTFLANNPGLSLDRDGLLRVAGITSQLAKRDYDLGQLAADNRYNWDKWNGIVKNYDKKNPVKDPMTGKVITTDSIIAPGAAKTTTTTTGGDPHPEGSIAINPKTGEQLKKTNGKWMPFT